MIAMLGSKSVGECASRQLPRKVTVAFLAFGGQTPVSGDGRADLARSVDYRLELRPGGWPLRPTKEI